MPADPSDPRSARHRALLPDYELVLKGLDRSSGDVAGPFAAGNGTITFRPVPSGLVWSVDLVVVGGDPSLGAARVNIYRNSITPDQLLGTVLLGATDPGAIFSQDGIAPWLVAGERIIATVVGGPAGVFCSGRIDYRSYELRPVGPRALPGDPGFPGTADVDAGTGLPSQDAPDAQDLHDRQPILPDPDGPPPRHPLDGGLFPDVERDPAVPEAVPAAPPAGGGF